MESRNVGKYTYISIHELLHTKDELEEEKLRECISGFSCSINRTVEKFLKDSSIEFAKKHQSITYLIFCNDTEEIVGYFTIALKVLSVDGNKVSKTVRKKLSRVSKIDTEMNQYMLPAFLIAQLGKNYAIKSTITGTEILEMAWNIIKEVQERVGGLVVFLETEDCGKLLDFYKNNNFRPFDIRKKSTEDETKGYFVQLLKLL